MQITKKERRQRRAVRTRAKIRELGQPRLTIHRTPRHIYAQVFDSSGAKVLVAASTVQDAVANGLTGTGNVEAAKAVGRAIAERAKAAGISRVAFDRAGFMYHGRVKALADAAPDRAQLVQYATSWEGRPLYYLILSAPQNIARLEAIRADMAAIAAGRAGNGSALPVTWQTRAMEGS